MLLSAPVTDQDPLVDEVVKIPGSRSARGAGDRNIVLGAQAAFEALHSFAENPGLNGKAALPVDITPRHRIGSAKCKRLRASA